MVKLTMVKFGLEHALSPYMYALSPYMLCQTFRNILFLNKIAATKQQKAKYVRE